MSDYTFQLADEQVDNIITTELEWHYNTLVRDLKSLDIDADRLPVFSHDDEEEREELLNHIVAFRKVLAWYGKDMLSYED